MKKQNGGEKQAKDEMLGIRNIKKLVNGYKI